MPTRKKYSKHQADDDGQVFRGNGKLTPEQEEIRQLKARAKQLVNAALLLD